MTTVGFKPTTSKSLSGGITPRLTHHFNHLATEDWYYVYHLYIYDGHLSFIMFMCMKNMCNQLGD